MNNNPTRTSGTAPASEKTGSAAPKKKRSLAKIIAIAVGAVLLVFAVLLSVSWFTTPKLSPAALSPIEAEAAVETVEAYFAAIEEGDADAALQYLNTSELQSWGESPLLSDAALAASKALAPISELEVKLSDNSEEGALNPLVTASFKVGDKAVTQDFRVAKHESGGVYLTNGTVRISPNDFDLFNHGGAVVNGVEIADNNTLNAFPGAFQVALGKPYYELTGETEFTAVNPDEEIAFEDLGFEMKLSQSAIDEYRTLVGAALDECLASTEVTSPCGIDIPATLDSGETIVPGSVIRTLTDAGKQALAELTPEQSLSDPMKLTADVRFATNIAVQATKNGQTVSGTIEWGLALGSDSAGGSGGLGASDSTGAKRPVLDLNADTPKVTWE